MGDLRRFKDQNMFVEYSKKKNELDLFREQAFERVQEMSAIAYDIVRRKLMEDYYDARFTPVRYQGLLNKVYGRVQIAKKHPYDRLERISFSGDEIVGIAYNSFEKRVAFSVTYDELVMTDREFRIRVEKTIARAEKESLEEDDCLGFLAAGPYQAIIDKQRGFFKSLDGFDDLERIYGIEHATA